MNTVAQPHPPNQIYAKASLAVSVVTLLFGNALWQKFADTVDLRIGGPNTDAPACTLAVLNVLLATYALWYVRPSHARTFTAPKELTAEARETIVQMVHGWRYLWATWIVMYVWLGLLWLGIFGNTRSPWYVAGVLNAVNGFWFYYLYLVLDIPSVPTAAYPNRAAGFRSAVEVAAFAGIVVCAISILTDAFAATRSEVADGTLAGQVIPAYAAIGMAFFFGRLDSHYLRFPRVVLAPLYLYVVMQLSWGRLEGAAGATDRVLLLGLAWILKAVVLYYVSKGFADGSFGRYIVELNKAEPEITGTA